MPNLNMSSGPVKPNMTASSTPLGTLNAARRPAGPSPIPSTVKSGLPQNIQEKMKAFHLTRQGAPQIPTGRAAGSSVPGGAIGGGLAMPNAMSPAAGVPLVGSPGGMRLPGAVRPGTMNVNSAPAVPNLRMNPRMGLAAKRGLNGGMKLSDANGPSPAAQPRGDAGLAATDLPPAQPENAFSKYSQYVDTATGTLNFAGKATIHGSGVDFSSGSSFNMSLDEVDTLEELGKGTMAPCIRYDMLGHVCADQVLVLLVIGLPRFLSIPIPPTTTQIPPHPNQVVTPN
jgi:mitogen-activated protein kinase kinase